MRISSERPLAQALVAGASEWAAWNAFSGGVDALRPGAALGQVHLVQERARGRVPIIR